MPSLINPYAFGVAGSAFDAAVMADSPLWYGHHGEPSGTTMVDSSGNAHDGSYTNSPALAQAGIAGDSDTCVDFNGTTQRAQVAFGSWMSVTTIAVETIIKPDTLSGFRLFVARDSLAGVSTNSNWHLRLNGNKVEVVLNFGAKTVTGVTSLVTGTRYAVGFRYDKTNVQVMVNGAVDATSAYTPDLLTSGNQPLDIGAASGGGGSFFYDGKQAKTSIYTSLSAARFLAHAQAAGLA